MAAPPSPYINGNIQPGFYGFKNYAYTNLVLFANGSTNGVIPVTGQTAPVFTGDTWKLEGTESDATSMTVRHVESCLYMGLKSDEVVLESTPVWWSFWQAYNATGNFLIATSDLNVGLPSGESGTNVVAGPAHTSAANGADIDHTQFWAQEPRDQGTSSICNE